MSGHHGQLVLAATLLAGLLAVQAAVIDLDSKEMLGFGGPVDPACTAAKKTEICSDCSTITQCKKVGDDWYKLRSTPCPAETPWCRNGACQKDPVTCLLGPTDAFTCTSDGYFPNLSSCDKYWVCQDKQAYAGDCSAYNNAVYDQRSGQCVPRRSRAACGSISCTCGTDYELYAPAPWLYVLCVDNDAANAMVFACANRDQRYNGTHCVNACNRAGRFPLYDVDSTSATDIASYYECVDTYGDGLDFTGPVVGICPRAPGFAFFNKATGLCEPN